MRVLGQKNYRGGAKRPPPPSLYRVKETVSVISSARSCKHDKAVPLKALSEL